MCIRVQLNIWKNLHSTLMGFPRAEDTGKTRAYIEDFSNLIGIVCAQLQLGESVHPYGANSMMYMYGVFQEPGLTVWGETLGIRNGNEAVAPVAEFDSRFC